MKEELSIEEVKELQEGDVLKYQYLGVGSKDSNPLTVKVIGQEDGIIRLKSTLAGLTLMLSSYGERWILYREGKNE